MEDFGETGPVHETQQEQLAAAPDVGHADPLIDEAADLASQLLRNDPERLAHSSRVADQAEALAVTVAPEDRAVLVSAAWLHDIGYSLSVRQTGFHPVDGARHLRRLGWPTLVQDLVAHHSGSRFVAAVRGLEPLLVEFSFEENELSDALTVADQTVGRGGRLMTVDERMADMLRRHGADSPNGLAHAQREPYLIAAARRVASRLEDQGRPPRHPILLAHPH
jgi:putative nucleotidyltransferase with HDIG domain